MWLRIWIEKQRKGLINKKKCDYRWDTMKSEALKLKWENVRGK